jgi:hypothetical protein
VVVHTNKLIIPLNLWLWLFKLVMVACKEYDNEKVYSYTMFQDSFANYFFTILDTGVKYRLTVIKWQWAKSIKGTCTSVSDYITEPNYTSYLWLTVMTILDTIQAVFSLQPIKFNSKAN